jgi:very-short-patch-repair endonuclease
MYAEKNDKRLKAKRRQLRKTMTYAERILWELLRGRRLDGLRFQRQYSIGEYIIDFYCPALCLAIELDGPTHIEPAGRDHDTRRTSFLEAQGVVVLRFWNEEIFERCDNVTARISEVASAIRAERQQ